MRRLSLFVRLLLASACLTGAVYALRFTRAELFARQNTPGSLEQATRLIPSAPSYLFALANLEPAREIALVTQALSLNPFNSSAWIRLGLDAELSRHDPKRAEQLYLKAAQIDRMYLPRLSLANFYFRRQRVADCLHWARAALEVTPSDAANLLSELSALLDDPARLDALVPNRKEVLYDYLAFLIANRNPDLFASTAKRILAVDKNAGQPEPLSRHRDSLEASVTAALAAGREDVALKLWADLHRQGIVRTAVAQPASPIANGDFDTQITNFGFDWTGTPQLGISIEQFPESHRLKINLTGTQPESCRLLAQTAPFQPGKRYLLKWTAELDPPASGQGFFWRIYVLHGAETIPTPLVSPDLTSPSQLDNSWQFDVPAAGPVFVLSLDYRRQPGQTRYDGAIGLLHVEAKAL